MPAAWNESIVATVLWVLLHVAIIAILWWLLFDKDEDE